MATFPLRAAINATAWNRFNLGYDRRDAGGYFEWQKNSPWYFRADGNQVTTEGTKVGAAAGGTSPGNGYVDLAFPTEYKTSNWGAEGGYQSSKMTFACAGTTAASTIQMRRCCGPTRTSDGREQSRQVVAAAGQQFNKFTAPPATATCHGGR